MLIGVDRDDVLMQFKQAFLDFYNRKHWAAYRLEEGASGDPRVFFGISSFQVLVEYLDFYRTTHCFLDVPPVAGAIDGVKTLYEKGHQFSLVTAVPQLFHTATVNYLRHHFQEQYEAFVSIHGVPLQRFLQRVHWKARIYQECKVDAVLDRFAACCARMCRTGVAHVSP